jgi:Kef-type K+ transport system membrane component KefB
MRWVASLFALGLMMALFHRVTAGGPLEARATLTLGFLLLAGYLGGGLAAHARAQLPRLTGYLLVGFAVGPAWLGLVRRDEVDALRFIAEAAGAVIALAAGSELTIASLSHGRGALARVATGAMIGPFLTVTLVLLSISRWFPVTVHRPFGDAVAVALALGALAAASSPVVNMALMSEVDARGPFARTLLAVTVTKDVAVVILFTLALAAGKAFARAGALHGAVVTSALLELGGSLVVGALLGGALGQYLRLVRGDTALFLVATAFVTAEVARLAQLETLIVALAAGFSLERFAPVESERLRREFRRGAPLVSVAYFTLAGTGLRLGALAELWPWVLLLVGLRAVGLRVGLRWAGRSPDVAAALVREGWLGLISQAGIALGLAQIARRAFPAWGVSLEALVVAMIGVHELLGPIAFRRALVRVGEITERTADGAGPVEAEAIAATRGDR